MGLHTTAKRVGSGAFVKLASGEVAEISIDTRLDATEDASHDTQPPRPCTGTGCPLCAAGVKRRVRYKLTVRQREAGQWTQKIWGVSPTLLKCIGLVTPEDSKARIEVTRVGDGLASVYRLRYLASEVTHTGPREATTERAEDRHDDDPPVTAPVPGDEEF